MHDEDLRHCYICGGFCRLFELLIARYVPCDHCDGKGQRHAANDAMLGPAIPASVSDS